MVEQTLAPISRVDVEKLYSENMAPESWLELEVRTVELLENGVLAEGQSRALIYALRSLAERGEPVPQDPSELYLQARPVLESLPQPIA